MISETYLPWLDRSMRVFIRPLLILALAMIYILSACSPPGSVVPSGSSSPAQVDLTVYLVDLNHYRVGVEPYEMEVTRTIPLSADAMTPSTIFLAEEVLTQLFLGPTDAERATGLAVVMSGATGFSNLTIEDGIARVYLTGTCASRGATYTIANLVFANLRQFPEIRWVKIYDQNNETETPDGPTDSIPICLEP
jgi:hypothetical protein